MIKFVADVGANHNKDLNRTLALIATAKSCGCDAVKFQLFKAERLYAPEFSDKIEAVRTGELPMAFIPEITTRCRQLGIKFHCTPFDITGMFVLRSYVDAFKIASYSILDLKLIEAAAGQGLPIGISTGGATWEEMQAAYRQAALHLKHEAITMYYCIPIYPAPVYPRMMDKLTDICNAYSDHTRCTEAILAAIRRGATTVEFHLDLNDSKGTESQYGHCWTAEQARTMITSAHTFDMILNGQEEIIDYTEMRKWRADPADEMRPQKAYRKELVIRN